MPFNVQIGKVIISGGGCCSRCGSAALDFTGVVGWRPGTRGIFDQRGSGLTCAVAQCMRCGLRDPVHHNCEHVEATSGTV